MPIVQAGTLDTTALVVPDLYVQVVPPQNLVLNGVPTNVIGVVGSAGWGPVNQPVIVSTMADYARAFGPIQARRFDMGTQVATAVQQGAQSFRCVRVTDGSETAASYAIAYANGQYPVLLTARYAGSLGNAIGITLGAGSAAGSFWGVRGGHNSSSNAATNGDNYTRLTNFIAQTLSAGMGQYVGQVISAGLFRRIRSTQLSFLQGLLAQGILGSTDGAQPFTVICDASNNPVSRTSLGYVQSDAQVQYQAINERFIVNLEGGQTVQVTRQTLPAGQIS